MLANAVAPSQRAAGSLPAPRLTPARSPDTGTATAANVQTPAEPLTALSLNECSARRWKTGRRAVRSFDPYYSLTLMLELRGPDYSRSPTPRVV